MRPEVAVRRRQSSPHRPGSRSRATTIRRRRVVRGAATDRDSVSGATDGLGALTAVVVIVPARNEAGTVAACLASIDRAAARTTLDVSVVLAADCCHDDTAAVARSAPMANCRLVVIEGRWRSAGPARRAAVRAGLAVIGAERSTVWLASTDADCVVPDSWLERQVRHAVRGRAAVAGIVELDPVATPAHLLAEFTATYRLAGEVHHHVHAANFGVRADLYEAVGGWGEHSMVGEDHGLWNRLLAVGAAVHQPTDVVVTTSGRTAGRVVGGFASRLALLERQADPVPRRRDRGTRSRCVERRTSRRVRRMWRSTSCRRRQLLPDLTLRCGPGVGVEHGRALQSPVIRPRMRSMSRWPRWRYASCTASKPTGWRAPQPSPVCCGRVVHRRRPAWVRRRLETGFKLMGPDRPSAHLVALSLATSSRTTP